MLTLAMLATARSVGPEAPAWMAYESERLAIRRAVLWPPESTPMIGYARPLQPWCRPSPRHYPYVWGATGTVVVHVPPQTADDWAVFQGGARLTVPQFFRLVDSREALADLDGRISKTQLTANGLRGLGTLGVAVLAVGIGGLLTDPDQSDEPWTGLMAGGLTVSLVGFGGASLATTRTNHLTNDFHRLDPSAVRAEVDAYNEQLRNDLGLSGGFGAPTQELESQR